MNKLLAAISTVNNHAKNAKGIYIYKHKALQKLLRENKAKKIGIQRLAPQQFYTLVQADDYIFHIRSTSSDLKQLPVVEIDQTHKNPKEHMNVRQAKQVIEDYLGYKLDSQKHRKPTRKKNNHVMISSFLDGNRRR